MNQFVLFATFGYDFALTGWPVWSAAGLGIGLATLLTHRLQLQQGARVFIKVIAPILMLWLLWFTRWLGSYHSPFFFYKSYHAQLDVAYIVAYAFGLAFCLSSIRASEKAARISGFLAGLVYFSLVPFMIGYVREMYHWYEMLP